MNKFNLSLGFDPDEGHGFSLIVSTKEELLTAINEFFDTYKGGNVTIHIEVPEDDEA